ncbi:autotransporter outer membrane beta-barrel domain-containing protein [Bradyrhizobium sp.]|uniref:autotransporter outer membrane beta-barrel domain-containing protein n=1 Tax=Bradyrhizobium sp. TaxID=376 RepID=UPI0039E3FA51
MSADVRARLSLMLLTAALLLPGPAGAQVMRELGAFSGAQGFTLGGPAGPGTNFNYLAGPALGGPQAPGFPGVPFGNGGGWGGPQQAFGGGSDASVQAGTAQATFLAMTQFTQTLLDPTIDGRNIGPAEFNAELAAYASLGEDRTHGGIGREAYEAIYGKPSLAAPQWSIWAAGFGGSQVSTGGAGSANRIFGTIVGADYALSPQTRMGFALAGGGTGFANSFSSGRSDLFQAGAFVRHTAGAAYVSTALAYGWQAITNDHPATPANSDQFNASTAANAYSGRLEGGYRFATPWLGITPYAAAQITIFRLASPADQPAYAGNAFTAALGSDSFTDSRTELGLRTTTSFALPGSIMSLRARLAWAHDFSAAQSTPAAFQSLPGYGFADGSAMLAPDAALVGMSFELRAVNGWSAAMNFDSEVSRLVHAYTGKALIRYAW